MNTSHNTLMAAGLSDPLSSTALSQSSGIVWKNGNVLTAQQMQQLDNAKMNVDSLGRPGFAPKLNALGQITNPVIGDVSGATATSDGKTVSQISQLANGSVQQTDANQPNGYAQLDGSGHVTVPVTGSVANAPANDAGDTVSSIADIAKSAQITANEAIQSTPADGRYVRNNAGTSGGIVALDLAGDGSGRVKFEKADGSWGDLQLAGDYATEEWSDGRYLQLSTANTQTVSGSVTFSGKTLVPNVDDFTSQEAIPVAQADERYAHKGAAFNIGDNTNKNNSNILYGNSYRLSFQSDGNLVLHDTSSNSVIFQLSGSSMLWQGNRVAMVGNLPLPVGQKIFTFTATVTGTQNIALPRAMSKVLFVTAQGGKAAMAAGMTNINSWTNSTVNVSVNYLFSGEPEPTKITQTFLVIAIP